MAITPRDNEAFYREVDEELRREQLQKGWRKYGVYIVGGVLLFLAALGGVIYWQHRQEAAAGERGEQMIAALQELQAGNRTAALPKLDSLAAEEGGYKAPALFAKATAALGAGDEKTALAALQAISDDQSLAEPFRDLALVKRTSIEFDRLPPDEVISRMKPLAIAGSPWFGSASEMVALAHLKAGRRQQAGPIFASIARDATVPESLRSRAAQMASAFGIDATGPEDANVRVVKEASE